MKKPFVRIYEEVKKIPIGQTATYGEIAYLTGTTPQVVGYTLHTNKDPKNVPCHRVIFQDDSLAKRHDFGGEGEQRIKLISQGVEIINNKVQQTKR